jgi:hypothetical protein
MTWRNSQGKPVSSSSTGWKIERTVKKPGHVTLDHRRVLVRAA